MAGHMNTTQKNMPDDFAPDDFLNNLFFVSKAVLLSPGLFYQGMKRNGGLRNPTLYLASCVLVHALIVGLLLKNGSLLALNLLFGMVFPFVTAGILFYIITNLFKASGTYEAAFRVNAYASAVALLSWMPVIGVLLEFYRLYLICMGLSNAFAIKTSRAFLAVLLTIFVYAIASLAIFQITGGQWPKAVS